VCGGSTPPGAIAVRKPARSAGHDVSERLFVSIPAVAADAGRAGIGGESFYGQRPLAASQKTTNSAIASTPKKIPPYQSIERGW
jgi:hypothetical protein